MGNQAERRPGSTYWCACFPHRRFHSAEAGGVLLTALTRASAGAHGRRCVRGGAHPRHHGSLASPPFPPKHYACASVSLPRLRHDPPPTRGGGFPLRQPRLTDGSLPRLPRDGSHPGLGAFHRSHPNPAPPFHGPGFRRLPGRSTRERRRFTYLAAVLPRSQPARPRFSHLPAVAGFADLGSPGHSSSASLLRSAARASARVTRGRRGSGDFRCDQRPATPRVAGRVTDGALLCGDASHGHLTPRSPLRTTPQASAGPLPVAAPQVSQGSANPNILGTSRYGLSVAASFPRLLARLSAQHRRRASLPVCLSPARCVANRAFGAPPLGAAECCSLTASVSATVALFTTRFSATDYARTRRLRRRPSRHRRTLPAPTRGAGPFHTIPTASASTQTITSRPPRPRDPAPRGRTHDPGLPSASGVYRARSGVTGVYRGVSAAPP